MMWKEDVLLLFYVALGGALGSVGRYLVAAALKGVWGNDFPWEMIFVNTFGCILVGFFAAFLYTKLPHPKWAMLLYWGIHRRFHGVFFFYQRRTALLSPWGTYYGVFLSAAPEYTGPIGSQPCFLGGKNIFLKE